MAKALEFKKSTILDNKGAFVKFNVRQKRKLVIIFARPPFPPKKETG